MQNRRNNRRRRRRGRFGFLYKLLSAVLIMGAIFAGCVVFFRVNQVRVEGCVHYTQAQIEEASGGKTGDKLFLLNKNHIARSILSALPYVDEVAIRRDLPDTLVVTITECTPVASIRSGENWWVMDDQGKLLEKGDEALGSKYAVVTGLTPILPETGINLAVGDEDRAKLKSLTQLLTALTGRGMAEKVSAVDLTDTATLTLRYDGRFTVQLPMTTDFDRKVWRLEEVVKLLESNESGTLDLTGDKGYFRPD
jgi:cell division protein FtsQ